MSEFRIKSTGEVVSQGELRRRNSNTSFPSVWNQNVFDFLGVDPILASPQPSNTDPLKTVRRNGVIEDSLGNWVENYEVVDMFADTTDLEGNTTTKAQHESAFLATRLANQWTNIRATRDNILKESDWMVIRATETDTTLDTEWATYRQALRDITEEADPFDITWPVKPE